MAKITDISHLLLKNHISIGDLVIDATCGNGFDTLFLASLVGSTGIVHAYDIQEQAINNAKNITKEYNNIIFHHESHENIDLENIKAVIFNLGYLPKGDKSITTTYESTKKIITKLVNSFDKNKKMLILIVVYVGHNEGEKESNWLEEFTSSLDTTYMCCKYQPINQHNSPYIITIEKK
jgi:methylase of polypeptide subunit release factors